MILSYAVCSVFTREELQLVEVGQLYRK